MKGRIKHTSHSSRKPEEDSNQTNERDARPASSRRPTRRRPTPSPYSVALLRRVLWLPSLNRQLKMPLHMSEHSYTRTGNPIRPLKIKLNNHDKTRGPRRIDPVVCVVTHRYRRRRAHRSTSSAPHSTRAKKTLPSHRTRDAPPVVVDRSDRERKT